MDTAITKPETFERSAYLPLSSSHVQHDAVPVWARFAYFLFGIGVLLIWNAILSALNMYVIIFPDVSVGRAFTIAYMWPMCVTTVFTMFLSSRHHHFRIKLGLLVFFIAAISLPAIAPMEPIAGKFSLRLWLTLGIVAIVGKTDAFIQSSLFATAALFPKGDCIHALNAGGGLAGVLIICLRILTLVLAPRFLEGTLSGAEDELSVMRPASWLFFGVCAGFCLACLLAFLLVERTPLWRLTVDANLTAASNEPARSSATDHLDELLLTLHDVELPVISIFATYAISLSMFPSIFTEIPFMADGLVRSSSYFIVGVVAMFCVGDCLGKFMPTLKVLDSIRVLMICTFARLAFLPVVVGAVQRWWVLGDNVSLATSFLFGLSNGLLSQSGLKAGPMLAPLSRRETSGRIMFLALISGLAFGSAVGAVFEKV